MRVPLYSIQELPSGTISLMARPRGGDWLTDEIKAIHEAKVDLLVSLLTYEEELELDLRQEAQYCKDQGLIYFSFPIQDRSIPPFAASTFTFLEQLSALLSEGKHITLHCRQGVGRSGLMAANLLVLRGFTPEQAFALLSKVRGCPVPETEEQRSWVIRYFHARNQETDWFGSSSNSKK